MVGETDLQQMLATIAVDRRPGEFCFLTAADGLVADAEATVREAEGLSIVVPVAAARTQGIEPEFIAAWLTLRVHSALASVGLTAAVSRVLADINISCNVIAGYHHDHLLVPVDRVDDAMAAIDTLRTGPVS